MNATVGSEYDSVFSGDINDFNITDNYSVKDVPFILNIGKNIKYIELLKSSQNNVYKIATTENVYVLKHYSKAAIKNSNLKDIKKVKLANCYIYVIIINSSIIITIRN